MLKSAIPRRRNTLRSREAAYEEALNVGDIETLEKIVAPEDEGPSGKRKRKRSVGLVDDSRHVFSRMSRFGEPFLIYASHFSAPKRKRSSPLPGSATSEKLNLPEFDGPGKETTDGGGSVNGSLKAESMSKGRSKRSKKDKDGSVDPEGNVVPHDQYCAPLTTLIRL